MVHLGSIILRQPGGFSTNLMGVSHFSFLSGKGEINQMLDQYDPESDQEHMVFC